MCIYQAPIPIPKIIESYCLSFLPVQVPRISNLNAKILSASWAASILAVNGVANLDLYTFIFGVSTFGGKLKELYKVLADTELVFQSKNTECLQLLTNSLRYNSLESLDNILSTPLD